jgi:hypothetical protein
MAETKLGWERIFALALVVHVAGTVTRWCFPELLTKSQIWALAAGVLVLKILIGFPEALRCYAQARRNGASTVEGVRNLVPAELIGLFRLERATQRGFVTWLRRRPPATTGIAGQSFEYYQGSQYATIFLIAMLCCVTEVPLSYLLMGIILNDPVAAQYAHWALLATVAYTMVLMLGDRHLVKHTRHVLAPQRLHLSVGARFHAQIPWEAVETAYPVQIAKELSEAKRAWLRRSGFDPLETVVCTPVDVPNVALVLKKSIPVKIEKYQIAQQDVRYVLVYVDEPGTFVQAVRNRLDAQQIA